MKAVRGGGSYEGYNSFYSFSRGRDAESEISNYIILNLKIQQSFLCERDFSIFLCGERSLRGFSRRHWEEDLPSR